MISSINFLTFLSIGFSFLSNRRIGNPRSFEVGFGVNNKIAKWLSEGSGWIIEKIRSHFVNIVKYLPLRGNSYLPLPEELRHPMKGLINLKNTDDKCFMWCHNRHLNPQKKNPQKITGLDRESAKKLDYSGITFPVTINDIKQIEKQNKININLFGYDIVKKIYLPS